MHNNKLNPQIHTVPLLQIETSLVLSAQPLQHSAAPRRRQDVRRCVTKVCVVDLVQSGAAKVILPHNAVDFGNRPEIVVQNISGGLTGGESLTDQITLGDVWCATAPTGSPVSAGRTTLTEDLCRALAHRCSMAVITHDIYTQKDADCLTRAQVLRADWIRGVETTGGARRFPHKPLVSNYNGGS